MKPRLLEKAIRIRRFVEYRDAPGSAGTVHSAIDQLEKLLHAGPASPVPASQIPASQLSDLCEAALHWLAAAAGNIDDSDGQITD